MSKIAEFNIMNDRRSQSKRSSCSVVINNSNTLKPSTFPTQVTYPCLDGNAYPSVMPQVVERDVNLEEGDETVSPSQLELYKTISATLAGILKDNNIKLIANIIDTSGKIIIDAPSLVKIIALIAECKPEEVHIEYLLQETECGCSPKINPIRSIEDIKVGTLNFKLAYNEKYNTLTDEYNISLKKLIIPSSYDF